MRWMHRLTLHRQRVVHTIQSSSSKAIQMILSIISLSSFIYSSKIKTHITHDFGLYCLNPFRVPFRFFCLYSWGDVSDELPSTIEIAKCFEAENLVHDIIWSHHHRHSSVVFFFPRANVIYILAVHASQLEALLFVTLGDLLMTQSIRHSFS